MHRLEHEIEIQDDCAVGVLYERAQQELDNPAINKGRMLRRGEGRAHA